MPVLQYYKRLRLETCWQREARDVCIITLNSPPLLFLFIYYYYYFFSLLSFLLPYFLHHFSYLQTPHHQCRSIILEYEGALYQVEVEVCVHLP